MPGVIVFDVDGCVLGAMGRPRAGARFTFDILRAVGLDVHLWSKAGARHARTAGRALGIDGERCHAKPRGALAASHGAYELGGIPVLTVDNNPADIPPGWPGLVVESWWA